MSAVKRFRIFGRKTGVLEKVQRSLVHVGLFCSSFQVAQNIIDFSLQSDVQTLFDGKREFWHPPLSVCIPVLT